MSTVACELYRLIILINCEIALKEEIPLTSGSEAVSIGAYESVDRGGNAIPVHPILPSEVQNCRIG